MQAHTLGEVGNLGTVSLRVFSGTILPIFIEIGSYLTDEEEKISWHSFFETRCSSLHKAGDICVQWAVELTLCSYWMDVCASS